MTQAARLQSLEDFRAGKAAFLLATDVAARGLDIQGVQVRLAHGTNEGGAPALKRCSVCAQRPALSTRVAAAAGAAVQVVLNYDAPRKLETHLHRIGRTARAGASGMAVTFIEDQDRQLLKEVRARVQPCAARRCPQH